MVPWVDVGRGCYRVVMGKRGDVEWLNWAKVAISSAMVLEWGYMLSSSMVRVGGARMVSYGCMF